MERITVHVSREDLEAIDTLVENVQCSADRTHIVESFDFDGEPIERIDGGRP